jgi:hypothetical protein
VNVELSQAPSQPGSVKLVNGKNSNAALSTSSAARQPAAAAAGGIGQSRIYDLHELVVS